MCTCVLCATRANTIGSIPSGDIGPGMPHAHIALVDATIDDIRKYEICLPENRWTVTPAVLDDTSRELVDRIPKSALISCICTDVQWEHTNQARDPSELSLGQAYPDRYATADKTMIFAHGRHTAEDTKPISTRVYEDVNCVVDCIARRNACEIVTLDSTLAATIVVLLGLCKSGFIAKLPVDQLGRAIRYHFGGGIDIPFIVYGAVHGPLGTPGDYESQEEQLLATLPDDEDALSVVQVAGLPMWTLYHVHSRAFEEAAAQDSPDPPENSQATTVIQPSLCTHGLLTCFVYGRDIGSMYVYADGTYRPWSFGAIWKYLAHGAPFDPKGMRSMVYDVDKGEKIPSIGQRVKLSTWRLQRHGAHELGADVCCPYIDDIPVCIEGTATCASVEPIGIVQCGVDLRVNLSHGNTTPCTTK